MGRVVQLFRYPVKSMLGEAVTRSWVGATGLAGDRRFAVRHTGSGRIASAKNPRLWRGLLTMSATTFDGEAAVITLADDTVLHSGRADTDEVLSEVLGQPVALTSSAVDGSFERAHPEEVLREGVDAVVGVDVGRVMEGTFFDFAPLHRSRPSAGSRAPGSMPRWCGPARSAREMPWSGFKPRVS